MINTGLRPSEALSLRRDQVTGDEFIIVGKGKKERKIYFNDTVHYWVDLYLSRRADTNPEVFITHPKFSYIMPRQMDLRRTQEQFKRCFELTGIHKRITPHILRHTYATTLLSNGCPLDYVAVLLGHAKVETTRRHYVSIQHKHAKHAHFRFLSYETNAPKNEYRLNPHNIHEQSLPPGAV
jgi:integrase/recombinase XerD